MDDGSLIIIIWVLCGYIGAFWLMAKGYTGELIGCAIAAGGAPILVPAAMGPLFLIAVEASKPTPNKVLLKGLVDVLLATLKVVPDVANAVTAVAPLLILLGQ